MAKDGLTAGAVAGALDAVAKLEKLSEAGHRHLAGVPPLSVMLNTALPVVEMETDRLTEAMTWLYDAVQALQRQSEAAAGDILRLEGILEEYGAVVQKEFADPGSGDDGGPAKAGEMRRMFQQQERNRIAEEKLLEMRIDSLQADIDSRLPVNCLDGIKATVGQRLEQVETKAHQDVGCLGSLLHNDFSDDRKRLERGFEALQRQSAEQLELIQRLVESNSEDSREARQKLEERLHKLEAAMSDGLSLQMRSPTRSNTALGELQALPDALLPEEGAEPRSDEVAHSLEERMAKLEATLTEEYTQKVFRNNPLLLRLEKRVSKLEHDENTSEVSRTWSRGNTHSEIASEDFNRKGSRSKDDMPERQPERPMTVSGDASELHALKKRIRRLEDVGGAQVQGKIAELTGAQAEIKMRMDQMESRAPSPNDGGAAIAGGLGGIGGSDAGLQQRVAERLASFESMCADLEAKQKGLERQREKGQKGLEDSLKKVSKSVEVLTGYLLKGATGEEEKMVADPYERLQRGMRNSLQTAQGHGLESRLRELEAELGAGLSERLRSFEKDLRKLDVDELQQVRPTVVQYRREQTAFNADIERELKELKVLVGCLEACVPKETRKAVQLFKRAAGVEANGEVDPQRLELEGRILGVQADVEARLSSAEAVVADQVEHVRAIVKDLERRHALLDERVASVSEQTETGSRPPGSRGVAGGPLDTAGSGWSPLTAQVQPGAAPQ